MRFVVRDTGIGIAADQAAQLFSAFVRADASMTAALRRQRPRPGHHAAARRDDGRRGRREQRAGVGNKFWFSARLLRRGRTVHDDEAGLSTPAAVLRRQFGARVLLVEDNEVNQEVMRERCAASAYRWKWAGDGLEAIAPAPPPRAGADGRADAAHGRPGGDAAAAPARRLRRGADHRDDRHAYGEDRIACLAAGMDDHLASRSIRRSCIAMLLRWLAHAGQARGAAAATAVAAADDQPAIGASTRTVAMRYLA